MILDGGEVWEGEGRKATNLETPHAGGDAVDKEDVVWGGLEALFGVPGK